ncbi:PEP/pyruvate-binding domain-containing protein [Hymenobacter caeli]|uniref:Pyruvate,water dikinase n=1 Tax=Hymenobacter caeli TaxID=2735894 RepID=A0ABX2FN57_9BACT|nr:PEP/pyruvate-binding domain-containing protein [Hymenobacter caeli]NRT18600.1 pyruvate,water dikinase [Hymenobacter caeli]
MSRFNSRPAASGLVSGAAARPAGATVGGKAAGLFRLRALGLAVPDFAVLPAELFDPLLAGLPTDAAGLAERRRRLAAFALPAAVEAHLSETLAAWDFPRQPVVVRSSVADEDGRTAAFPGLMDSRLHLTTLAAVRAAVAQCAASAYSARALAYRRRHGLALGARPALVVQRQVAATAAGVLFTTFPEYPQELAIHAVWGFGEGLVSGLLEPDEFYFDKQTGAPTHQKTALKTQQVVAGAGGGTAVAPVPAARQAQPCLGPAQLAELVALAARLEAQLGGPQDVEFVATPGRLWVVQARPVTQAIPAVVVYDNANIQESYCGVTTPLTFSFAQRAYATVYRQTMQVLGLPAATIRAHEAVVANLLALVRGRVYYHVNHWYRGLLLLPAFRQNKADLERMMGLTEPVDLVQSHEKTAREKLVLLPRLLLNLARLLAAFGQLPRRTAAFHAHFRGHFERFYQLPLNELSAPALLAEKARLDAGLLLNWTTPIVNDFRVMMANGAAQRRLAAAGIADAEEFLSRYLSGDQQLASARPAYALQALAQRVRREFPALRPLLLALPPDLPAQVQQQAPALHQDIQRYLAAYGDRSIGELKLETATMRTDPLLFFRYLRNYLLEEVEETAAPATTALRAGAGAELAARLRPRSAWFRRTVRRRLRQLQAAVGRREELRLERTRLFGMYRALYRELGQRLARAGALAAAADVFYLTEDEVAAAVAAPGPAWAARAAGRRQEFAQYEHEPGPARITVPARPPAAPAPGARPPGHWQGTGCYAGQVTGEVLCISGPDDSLAVAGKIVVAARTDPGWAVLFPACRGVLIERGSALSHSVILLRELGIPTIINVPGLPARLRSGQRVRMDGATGEITLLPDAAPDDNA